MGSYKRQEFQKNIYLCFIDYAKAFDCVDHNKLWKILKEMGIPDHLRWEYQAGQMVWNAGQAQAGIKIARRNINNLSYADYTTLMAEIEELKSLLMKVRVEKLA